MDGARSCRWPPAGQRRHPHKDGLGRTGASVPFFVPENGSRRRGGHQSGHQSVRRISRAKPRGPFSREPWRVCPLNVFNCCIFNCCIFNCLLHAGIHAANLRFFGRRGGDDESSPHLPRPNRPAHRPAQKQHKTGGPASAEHEMEMKSELTISSDSVHS